jgi:autotransporter-associated beta strand protein
VPDDTATFTNNAAPTSVAISNDASINTIQFTAGAPAFNFTTSGTGITFDVNGAGIVNNSAFAPSLINNDTLNFNGTSSAGNAVITNNNGAVLSFNNNSTAGNATITTNNGALTQFNDNSTGGNAQFITNAGGIVDFSNTSGPAGDGNISAGSIAGAGNYYLGSNLLTVGSNNLSTTVSGVISDCGPTGLECSASGATGGGLIKVGTGTLTLSGANTYTGPTAVNAGTLQAGAVNAFSSASAFTVASGATLNLAGFNQTIGSLAGAGSVTFGAATLTTNGDGSDTTFSGTISGSGRLVKVGGGTLTLSGNNSYQGGTALNEGTLAVGSSRALGTGALTLADGTTLQAAADGLALANAVRLNGAVTVDTKSNTTTLSGPISGTGGLDKIGSGTLTLTGASTYTGTTNVNEGVLNVNGSLVSTAIINNNGGVLSFNNTSTAANATITTNNGALTQFNDNSSAGNAAIINNNGGMVSFNNNSTAANATVTTNNGAHTQFNDNSTGGNAQFITNVGGTVDFSNTSGPAGDGNISAGSIAGAGNYYLGSNQLTVGSNNLSTTVSGVISDCGPTGLECSASGATGGGLTKVGSGTLTLAGANTYTGPTLVNGGVLNVTGSLVSAVTVNSGGTLTGIGAIGGLDVASGGTVAPGNSIGRLRVAGDVTFEQGSIYQVKANAAGQSGKLTSSGSATISGGTVQVLAQSGTYSRQTRYPILTASGGISGTFTGATSNLAFLTPVLSYDPNDVFLTLIRNDITFASLAQTRNQRAVAEALDRSPPLKPLVQAVANLTPAGTLQAFDALSGEVHASAQATIIDDSRYARQAILGRLRQAPYEGGAGATAALGAGGPMLAYADPPADGISVYPEGYRPAGRTWAYPEGYRPADGTLVYPEGYSPAPSNPPPRAPAPPPEMMFWAQGVGATGKINSDGNAAEVSRNLGGVFAGFDRRFGEWRVGLAAGYTNSSARVGARGSSANIDAAYFAAYGGASAGAWNVRLGGVFAWNTIATNRSIAFPGFTEQAGARYGAAEGQAFGEVGYALSFSDIAAEPFAGLAWVHLSADPFTETGGVSALSGSSSTDEVGYSTVGARWASNLLMTNGMLLVPRASLAWQHAFGTTTPTAALAFRSTGAAFGIWGVPIARDAALVEAGGDLHLSLQTKLGIFYVGQLATNAQDHSVKGNFTWRF